MSSSSPAFPSKTKNGRIHLSPLSVTYNGKPCHCKLRDYPASDDKTNSLKNSQSLHDISEAVRNKEAKENFQPSKICYDDRFIPRPVRDLPAAQAAVNGQKDEAEAYKKYQMDNLCEDIQEKYDLLRYCVSESDLNDDRILSFVRPPPRTHEAAVSKGVEFVRNQSTKPRWKLKRYVPKAPERVLDAPELVDDYYLNLLDWGGDNCIAVGLGPSVYVWSASTGQIAKLDESESTETSDYVSSVHWSGSSSSCCLSVGYSSGTTKIFDVRGSKCLRTLRDGNDRIGSLSWNENILSSGSRSGVITSYDVRVQHAQISRLSGAHIQEVCGLAWSYDGNHLASGGNDNQVYVWEKSSATSNGCYLRNYNSHTAAVKAVSWSPRECGVLATGGGTADRSINFWNVRSGSHLSRILTNSQVSGIVWNPYVNEIVTAHGHPQNQLTLWSYPSMQVASHLISHTGRILCISLSSDGTTVASIGADETLRLWKCFDPPPRHISSRENDILNKPRWDLH